MALRKGAFWRYLLGGIRSIFVRANTRYKLVIIYLKTNIYNIDHPKKDAVCFVF